MSFKREGNDHSLLSKLRKRRVDELLGGDIPRDEAKLLSNGRLTCTVCNSNPIFDTVNMLVLHRQGKKHLANLRIHESKKAELKHLIAVRKHEKFTKEGTTSIQMASPILGGVLTSAPYNACVKRAKLKPTDRRPCLNLHQRKPSISSSTSTSTGTSMHTSHIPSTTAGTSRWLEIAEEQLSGPVVHDCRLKSLCKDYAQDQKKTPQLRPYRTKKQKLLEIESDEAVFLNNNQSKKSTLNRRQTASSYLINPLKEPSGSTSSCSSPQVPFQLSVPSPPPPLSSSFSPSSISPNSDRISQTNSKMPVDTSAKTSVTERLKQLQGSGWRRDWDGKWIKDENAEFDSDEEAPDIPLLF